MEQLFERITIDSGKHGPHVLITAGVHGDELEPIIAVRELIQQIPPLLQKGKITFVPVVNESAYKLRQRCGSDGMDLARTCPGKSEGSITEKVAFEVSQLIQTADYYIDLHTGGRIFNIHPLVGYMLHDSQKVLSMQQEMAKAFGLPVVWGTDNRAEGRTLSVARDANVPAIYVEYGGPDPISAKIVKAYVEGCLRVLGLLAIISFENIQVEQDGLYWVEDGRLNNGHLQTKTPAPVEGIFFPNVKVGTPVRKGELWGVIQDPTSRQVKIKTEAEGLVLFMRVQGHVQVNDSLGGLLPISQPGKIIFHEQ